MKYALPLLCFLKLVVFAAIALGGFPAMASAQESAAEAKSFSKLVEIFPQTDGRLALWLKADAGVVTDEKGFVKTWADQSSQKNHAVQTSAVSRPLWVKAAANGRPALHFDGVTNFLAVPHTSSLVAENDFAIFAVVRTDNLMSSNSLLSKTDANLPAPFDFYLEPPLGQPRLFAGDRGNYSYVVGNSNVVAGQFNIVATVIRGTNGTMYFNGAFNGSASMTAPRKDAGGTLRIGTRDDFGHWLQGDLAEIILVHGPVSISEQTVIHAYLGEKYGIASVIDLSVGTEPVVCRFEGQTATFSVRAQAVEPGIQFQWQRDGVDIPDATNAIFTTPPLAFADRDHRYRVRVSAAGVVRFNGSAVIDVLADVEPLTVTTAAFLLRDQSRAASASEQTLPPYSSRFWPTGEGPARNVIQTIAQTSDGVLWVGTESGLAWFDGERFDFVPVGSGRTDQRINALSAGDDGSLWVGTAGEGLWQWRENKWIPHPLSDPSDRTILSLQRTASNVLWVGTRVGLTLLKNVKSSSAGDKLSSVDEKLVPGAPIRSLAQDRDGGLWVSVADQVIRLMEGAVTNLNMGAFRPTFLRTTYCARDGSVWIGANSGLVRLQDGELRHFSKTNGLPDNVVTAIYEDRRGNLWVGTSAGLCRFADEKFVVEMTSEGEAYDQIYCLFEDRENNLWVGAKNGFFQLRVQQFTTYTTRHGLAHNNVISVYEDREGAMWIGTWGGGLHCLRGGKLTIYSSARNKTMRNDLILAIHGARDGGIWFGADYDGGLYRLKGGELSRYAGEQGFSPNPVRALLEDSVGSLLIGTSLDSLKILEKGRVSNWNKAETLGKNIRCLLQAKDGSLWIGTENGLACKSNETLRTFTTKEGLSDNVIWSLHEDKEQNLWIGTAKGLNRMRRGSKTEGREERFTFYASTQGLFDDAILEMLEDDAENLWLASRRGVFRIRKSEFDEYDRGQKTKISCAAFGKADGMASSVCVGVAKPSACKSKDGRLWFATTKGLAVTDPKLQIEKNEKPPPVVIREILADKKPFLTRREESENVGKQESENSHLLLPPGRGELEFHYTALSYTAPEKNRFKYKLEGLDTEWVEADTRHTAFYNNVPPGDYTFRVMACNSDGVWNTLDANIKFSLSPHYWQTWWFKTFTIIASLSVVGVAVRYATKKRMQFKLERLEQQHSIEKERSRIARDLHDDLGAGLTEVLLLNDSAAKSISSELPAKGQIEKASQSARNLVRSLDGIVWAVDSKNDSLENFVTYTYEHIDRFFSASSIRLRRDVPDELPDCHLSSENRHNLFLVIKEALNNAAKYSSAGEIWFRLRFDNSVLSIFIEDNGKGFSSNTNSPSGNGLHNMRKRMESIGGSFSICSELGKGTRLHLELPLKSDVSLSR